MLMQVYDQKYFFKEIYAPVFLYKKISLLD